MNKSLFAWTDFQGGIYSHFVWLWNISSWLINVIEKQSEKKRGKSSIVNDDFIFGWFEYIYIYIYIYIIYIYIVLSQCWLSLSYTVGL